MAERLRGRRLREELRGVVAFGAVAEDGDAWEIIRGNLAGGQRKPGLAGDVFWGSLTAMTREELLQRIWIDPGRCSGQPCIRGHRIWVSLILDLLAAGESVETILENYPGISREDVQACIAYGSEMARERFVEIPLEPAGA